MIENKNPDEDIFNFNTEANSGSLYDAITKRFNKAKALALIGGAEETEIWRYNESYIVNYFAALDGLIEELSFLFEKIYHKMDDAKLSPHKDSFKSAI